MIERRAMMEGSLLGMELHSDSVVSTEALM